MNRQQNKKVYAAFISILYIRDGIQAHPVIDTPNWCIIFALIMRISPIHSILLST